MQLTPSQQTALTALDTFFQDDTQRVFLLKGYAGTGKTTLLKRVVERLQAEGRPNRLMAPTGRAARVLLRHTGEAAETIHRSIYNFDHLEESDDQTPDEESTYRYHYALRGEEEVVSEVFIVDEASMLSDILSEGEFFRFGSGFLLRDLIQFSKVTAPNLRTKLLFVGDPAQLPPVGMNSSPALDAAYLLTTYGLAALETELTHPVRQGTDSGILRVATSLRNQLRSQLFNYFDLRLPVADLVTLGRDDLIDAYLNSPQPRGLITYKNQTVRDLNADIRQRLFPNCSSPQPTDLVISGSNNRRYNLMNGDLATVVSVAEQTVSRVIPLKRGKEQRSVTLTWRELTLFVGDGATEETFNAYHLDNYLHAPGDLSPDERRALYVDFRTRNQPLKSGTEAFREALRLDPFFNALLLRYGYALTCHKAQGGEWPEVFVVWDYAENSGKGLANSDFFRWAYTAITRASTRLHNVGAPHFTPFSGLTFVPNAVRQAHAQATTGQVERTLSIRVDHELTQELTRFGLLGMPQPVQDHFLKVRMLSELHEITLTDVQHHQFQEVYSFQFNDQRATLRWHYNGKGEFRAPTALPNSEPVLSATLLDLFARPIRVVVERQTMETQVDQIEREFLDDEARPFLGALYEALSVAVAAHAISIDHVDHQTWCERYTFRRGSDTATLDFYYNAKGSFTNVREGAVTSEALLHDVVACLSALNS